MDQHEEWRPIAGFPDYLVSNLGRVVSQRVWRGRPGPRELVGGTNGDYRTVRLRAPAGGSCRRYIHHMVAEAFIGPRPDGHLIRHLDGDCLNNSASNLRYGTPSENELDKVRHGTHQWLSKGQCRNGHKRTTGNTRYWPSKPTSPVCLDCRRPADAAGARRRAAARAAA